MKKFIQLVFLLICYHSVFSQTTVTYVMLDADFPTQFNDGGDFFDNAGTELGMWANTGNKNTVGWRTFKTSGDNTGSNRTLQVGDVFKITVAATRAFGQIGFSLNAGGTSGSSYANRVSGSRLYFNTDNYGAWYVNNSGGSTVIGAGYTPIQDTYKDYIFTIKVTSSTTADVYLTVDGTDYRSYNLTMNGSGNIDAFSIYGSDLWDGNSNDNAYWKQTSSVTNSKTVELGYYLASGTYTPGIVSDGLDAASTSTVSVNAVNIGGNSGSSVLLNQANTYTGATTINANATLKLGNAAALGTTAAGTTITSGGVLDLNGTNYSSAETLTVNGTGISSGGAIINSNSTGATYAGLLTLGSAGSIVAGTGTINISNAGTISGSGFGLTLGGAQNGTMGSIIGTGTGSLIKNGAGTWTLTKANTYTGTTTINGGILQIGIANAIKTGAAGARSDIVFNGGTLNSGSGSGYNEGSSTSSCMGTITLNSSSTLALGTANILYFAASNGVTWAGSPQVLTITGWTGGMGTTGTGAHIYISTGGLTAQQLSQITFSGFPAGAMLIGGNGEIVPAIVATTYYSQCSCALQTTTNWNSSRTGSGYSPGSFSTSTGDKFVIQGTGGSLGAPHTMTCGSNVTFGAAGKDVTLEVEGGATLQHNSNITITAGSTFKLDANSYFIQNSSSPTTIVSGTEDWDVTSTITFTTNNFFANTNITGAYPNVIIQTGSNDDAAGIITQINGNLTINQGSGKIFYIRKANATANTTLTIAKSVFVSTGSLDLSQNSFSNTLIIQGDQLSISSGALITNSGSAASGTANINFTKNGTALYLDANASGGGLAAKPVNFSVISPCILDMGTQIMGPSTGTFTLNSGAGIITANTNATGALTTSGTNGSIQVSGTRTFSTGADYTYNASTAQTTGNGLPSTVHNLTINNSGGVTLNNTGVSVTIANNGSTNGTLYLTSGIFNTITNSGVTIVSNTGSVSRTNGWVYGSLQKYVSGSTNFEVGDGTYYTNVNVNGTSGISTAGLFTVKTNTLTEHPNIATSDIDQTKDDNSYFTLTNNAVTFTAGATIVFNYPSGDIDGGATATNFKLGNYNSGWTYPSAITAAANSMTVTGLTTFGEFQCGEASCTFGTWKGTAGTDWNTGTNWCGGIPTSSTDVVIPNVANKPLISNANAVAKSVTINSGSSLTMSGVYNLTITSGGVFANNAGSGGFIASSSTGSLIFSGSHTISGTNNFQNVSIANAGVDFGTASTINGTLTINSGAFINNGHPPIYACGTSVLKYNIGSTYNRGSEWISGAGIGSAGCPSYVQISNNTTLNYGTTGTATTICKDLTIDAGSSFNLGASTAALTVPGNVTANGAFSLSTAVGGDLSIGGNYIVGASVTPVNNGRSITFNGSSGNQTVTKTGGGTVYFDYLIINKSSGDLQLNNSPATNIQINSTTDNTGLYVLQLQNGSIDLNDQTFTLNGTVSNSTNIYTAGTGIRRIYTSTGTGNFDVTGSVATPGSQNLNVSRASGSSSLTFDANVTLTTNVGVDFGPSGMTLVNSIFQINQNGFCINNSPDYGNASTLIYNNGSGGFNRNVEWNTNVSGAGFPNNVIVKNNTPLTLDNYSFTAAGLGTSGYLDIQSGASVLMGSLAKSLSVGTDLTISGTLTLSSASGGDLNVGANWTRTGTFTQNGRNVTFNSSNNGILTATGGQLFSFVYLNKSAKANTLTLASDVSVSDEVGFTQGTLNLSTNNKFFTLLSTATKTARVAQSSAVNTAFSYGSGNFGQFIVQRYFPARRAWRLVSPPVSGTNATISQAWQEGMAFDYASTGTQPSDSVTAGFATQITGAATTSGGFDLSYKNNPSIFYYTSSAWTAPSNTNATSVKSREGWMLFVRGDRKNFGQITTQYKTPTITTLRPRGEIFIGAKAITSSGMTVVGNPYASALDFHTATKTGTLTDTYYMWDPLMGGTYGVGAFVTLTWNGSNYTRSAPHTGIGTSSIDNRYIPSGAAIMVDFGASSSTLTFNETDKTTASSTTAFRPVSNIRTTLNSVETDGTTFVSDGVVNLFSDAYSNDVTQEDAVKLQNIEGENFSTKRNNILLSIEKRKLLDQNDTIFYNWSKVKVRDYQLEISTDSLADSWMDIYLEDNYKKSKTKLDLLDTLRYNFKIVKEDSGTFKADRFHLILNYTPPVITEITAWQQNSNIALQWTVNNERNIENYVIEKSQDGISFTKVGEMKDVGKIPTYNWLDIQPVIGQNFYRIYGLGENGKKVYSSIVRVKIESPSFVIYPNPVANGTIGVQITNLPKGFYNYKLINSLGQTILNKDIDHPGGNGTVRIPLGNIRVKGIYQLEVSKPDHSKETIKVIY